MAIKFLLFDKERRLYPVFGDILDVTGHKLMVAFEESKAIDLLNILDPDLIILSLKDINFFWDIIKSGKFPLPMFLVEDYKEADKIKELGFSEFNILMLPFNPLEFLNKSVKLDNLSRHLESTILSNFGITNVIFSLLSRNVSAGLSIREGDRTCEIYLKEGLIKGFSCTPKEFIEIIKSEDVSVSFLLYEPEAKLGTYFKNNGEFFSLFTSPLLKETQEVPQKEKFTPSETLPSLFPIGDKFFLISATDTEGLLQRNVYLRVYEKDDLRVPMLFNSVPSQQFSTLKENLENVLGSLEHLRGLILMDLLPEDTQSILNLLSLAPRLYIITSFPIATSLISLGVPEKRIKLIESFPDDLLGLGTGDTLRFIKTPFLPDKGSFVTLEEKKKILFSSKLFSSYCLPEDYSPNATSKVEMVMLYHSVNFLTTENSSVLARIRLLNPVAIRPAFGNPILENVGELIDKISKHKVVFNQANLEDDSLVLGLVNSMLLEIENGMPKEKYENLLDNLSEYADVKNGVVSKIFIDMRRFPELFLYTLHSVKPAPRTLLSVLHKFVKAKIPLFTI